MLKTISTGFNYLKHLLEFHISFEIYTIAISSYVILAFESLDCSKTNRAIAWKIYQG